LFWIFAPITNDFLLIEFKEKFNEEDGSVKEMGSS